MMVACMAVLLAGYVILTWPKKVESEAPTVIVESLGNQCNQKPTLYNHGRAIAKHRQKTKLFG